MEQITMAEKYLRVYILSDLRQVTVGFRIKYYSLNKIDYLFNQRSTFFRRLITC